MAQSVKDLTLDFCSGHDLTVCEIKPPVGVCADSVGPAWDSLSLSLSVSQSVSAPPSLMLSLSVSLKINKKNILKKILKKIKNCIEFQSKIMQMVLLISNSHVQTFSIKSIY